MNKYVFIGQTFGPFGIKGEIKIQSDSNHQDLIFKENNTLYIDNKEYIIKTLKVHKNNYLVSFIGYEDINLINDLLNKEVYVLRKNYDVEYFYSELLGLDIFDNDNFIGKVDCILLSKKDTYLKSSDIIIPVNEKYVEKIDIVNQKIYCKNVSELGVK